MHFTQTTSGCDSDLGVLEGQALGYGGRRYRQAVEQIKTPTFEWVHEHKKLRLSG